MLQLVLGNPPFLAIFTRLSVKAEYMTLAKVQTAIDSSASLELEHI